MTPIGLFYGTDTGFTQIVTDLIVEEFNGIAPDLVSVHNVGDEPVAKMLDYPYLIVGCPTWNIGQLQDDWDDQFLALDALDLTGKKIAIFGLGDQFGYPESFCDAIGILGRKFIAQGAELVGFTPAAGYEFTHSEGIAGGMFMGLALDDENENAKTPGKITDWVWQLVDEFDLVHLLEPALA
ncbi:MAG: flavodoxin [Chloroflexota bacterium]|nr:flavodoxin [Ardenticatenaceae bacterium]GIK57387.1 MAG: flavodoxin [Chloroflexota bacterium]